MTRICENEAGFEFTPKFSLGPEFLDVNSCLLGSLWTCAASRIIYMAWLLPHSFLSSFLQHCQANNFTINLEETEKLIERDRAESLERTVESILSRVLPAILYANSIIAWI